MDKLERYGEPSYECIYTKEGEQGIEKLPPDFAPCRKACHDFAMQPAPLEEHITEQPRQPREQEALVRAKRFQHL